MSELTHLNTAGAVHMGDVGDCSPTWRAATAQGDRAMAPAVLALVVAGDALKGDG